MRVRLMCASVVAVGLAIVAHASGAAVPDGAGEKVIATMRSIRAASAAGDVDKWNALVASGCVFVEPTGHLQARERHVPKGPGLPSAVKTSSELRDLKVQDSGETAVLTYIETTETKIGENSSVSVVRFSEVYKRAGEGWQMILSAETPIPQRQAVKVDPATFDELVGDYQLAPGMIGTVSREGAHLMLKGTGWTKAYELLPLGKDTFFVREFENTEIVFQRDEKGNVIQHVSRTNGQEMVAKKVK